MPWSCGPISTALSDWLCSLFVSSRSKSISKPLGTVCGTSATLSDSPFCSGKVPLPPGNNSTKPGCVPSSTALIAPAYSTSDIVVLATFLRLPINHTNSNRTTTMPATGNANPEIEAPDSAPSLNRYDAIKAVPGIFATTEFWLVVGDPWRAITTGGPLAARCRISRKPCTCTDVTASFITAALILKCKKPFSVPSSTIRSNITRCSLSVPPRWISTGTCSSLFAASFSISIEAKVRGGDSVR